MKHKINIAGVHFDPVRYEDVLTAIEVFVKQPHGKHYIVTPNPEMLVHAQKDPNFLRILNGASLSIADGIGILWATHYLSKPVSRGLLGSSSALWLSLFKVLIKHPDIYSVLPQRVTGADLLFKIVDRSQKTGWRIFLLGAAPGVANAAIERLLKKYPHAIFAGSFAGTPAMTHEDELCGLINKAQADILFVAYGSPAQEEWIYRNLEKLKTVKVAIGVGGAIDFAAGKRKRAPRFMQNFGLEWLWRLIREPRRIGRIHNATLVFIRMIVRLKNKLETKLWD